MRIKNRVLCLALTAMIGLTWVAVSHAVEHPWDVDNRPGSGAPALPGTASGVGTNPRPGTDTSKVSSGASGASVGTQSGVIAPSTSRQQYSSNWFQALQWWLVRTIAQFNGGSGDVE